ncbi:MAG: hypothetical protein KC502_22935, partial [Myxococcales bacterium]|nr:hypothetical protein [Myxococcales bacterium]
MWLFGRGLGVLAMLFMLSCDSRFAPEPATLAEPVSLQLRWGGGTSGPQRWDGSVSVDCGRIDDVRAVELESGDGVLIDAQTDEWARARWRSEVDAGFDGVTARIFPCAGQPGSTLTVTTPNKRWTARLSWIADDYVSLPVS